MLAPSPIAAQTIVISREEIRNNNAKRTTGLEAEITCSLARYNRTPSSPALPRDGAFKGLELDDNVKARDGEPRCGAYIVDTRTGDIMHWIRFEGAVRELFDAAFIPGVRAPMCVGLGNPEMRTLITFSGDTTSSKAEVAA